MCLNDEIEKLNFNCGKIENEAWYKYRIKRN